MKIKKSNGKIENFNINKIKNAVKKAFTATEERYTPEVDKGLEDKFNEFMISKPETSIEEVQNMVEQFLIRRDYEKVAKAYILYRWTHKAKRDFVFSKEKFIQNFVQSSNTANATIDDNSNVSNHNIAVLNAEIHKEDNKNTNMYLWEQKIRSMYPEITKGQFEEDMRTIMYAHDSSSQVLMPYCMAVSLYPFLLNGLKTMGGLSAKPENIDSYCGILVNLIFKLSSEVKGAVAVPEALLYFTYFCIKEWGNIFYLKPDIIISQNTNRTKTIESQIIQYFQQITYSINQPSAARGSQSAFVNFSFFDKEFYNGLFGDFRFPDGSKVEWEAFDYIQKLYLHWLNEERLKCVLTFPVCSLAMINKDGEWLDKDTFNYATQEYANGNSFFTYISDSVDSLSSCCRLRNAITENTFNFTNGQIGIMTGSKNVITLNINRIVQDATEEQKTIENKLIEVLDRVYKYQTAYNELLVECYNNNLYDAYSAGYIDLDKQYLTIGVNGLNAAADYLGIKSTCNEEYYLFCELILNTIKEQNTLHKTKHLMFNTEFTPCESAAIKLYNRDQKDGYFVPKDINLYTSYFFKPYDKTISVLDKIKLHGIGGGYCDGGSACHINLEEHLTQDQYAKLLNYAAETNCNYLTFNIPNTECSECGYITKHPLNECPRCHSKKLIIYDRVIGYLTAVKNWSDGRQKEQSKRVYTKKSEI